MNIFSGIFQSIQRRLTVLIVLLVMIPTITIGVVVISQWQDSLRVQINELEEERISEHAIQMEDFLVGTEADIRYLANNPNVEGLAEALEADDEERIAELTTVLEEDFLAFSNARGIYDQIRFFDTAGNEIVRVDRNNVEAESAFVVENLQNKADRSYYVGTVSQPENGIYVSALNLNREGSPSQIEVQPNGEIVPVLRYGMPIFVNGQRVGVVVTNVFARELLNLLEDPNNPEDAHVYLVSVPVGETYANTEGAYLYNSANPLREFGYESGIDTLAQDNPNIEGVTNRIAGYDILDDYITVEEFNELKAAPQPINEMFPSVGDDLFLHYLRIAPPSAEGYYWLLITERDQSVLLSEVNQIASVGLLVMVVVFGVIVVIATLFSRQISAPLTRLSEQAQRIAQGDLAESLGVMTNRRDEIGVLGRAFDDMATQLRELFTSMEARIAARTNDLETSAEIAAAANQVRETSDLLSLTVNLIRDRFDLYYVQVYLLDPEKKNAVLRDGTGYVGRKLIANRHRLPLDGRSIVANTFRRNAPQVVNDTAEDDSFLANELLPETRSEVAIPLRLQGEVIGVLDIQHNEANFLDDSTLRLFQSMADQLAVIFENVDLLQSTERRAAELETVATVSATASTILDIDEMLKEVVTLTRDNFRLYHAHIYLLNDAGDTLQLAAGAGEPGRIMVERGHSIPLDREHSLVATAARERRGVIVNDVTADPDFLPNELLPETKSEMAIPVIVGEDLIGVLDVQSTEFDRFDNEDVRVKTTLASQVGVAVQNGRAFERVEEARQEVERVFSASIDMLGSANFQGYFTSLNPAWGKTLGWTEAELMAKPFIDFVHPDDVEMTNNEAAKIFGGNDTVSFENRYLHKDGSYRWVAWNSAADVENELVHFVARDVTAAKEATLEMERQSTIIETSNDFIALTTMDGVIEYLNPGGMKMMGFASMDEALRSRIQDYHTPEDAERVLNEGVLTILEEGTWRTENRLITKDGRVVDVEQTLFIVRDEFGNPRNIATIMSDITERKAQEAQLAENEARLSDAVRTARLGYWEFDVAIGNFTFNDDFYALLGTSLKAEGSTQMPAEEYAGRFVVPEQAPVVAEAIGAAMETTDPNFTMDLESDIIRADNGERRTLAVRLRIEKDEDGNTVKLIGANQDITETKLQQKFTENLASVSAALSQARDEDDILAAVARIAEPYGMSIANLNYLEMDDDGHPNVLEIMAARSGDGEQLPLSIFPATRMTREQFPLLKTITDGTANHAFFVEDVENDPNIDDMTREFMRASQIGAGISINLKRADRWLASLALNWNQPTAMPEDFRALIEAILPTLSSVVASRRAYLDAETANRESARRADELAVVADVSAEASTVLDVQDLLWDVSNLTKERFDLYHAHIYLLNDAGDTLVLTAGAGDAGKTMVAEHRTIPFDAEKSLVATAAREREGVVVNDVTADPNFLPHPMLPNTKSEMAIPMIVGGDVVGVLDVQADVIDRFTQEDVRVQTTLAGQIAVAIQNARSFEQAQKQSEELAIVSEVSAKISTILDPEELIKEVAEVTARSFDLYHLHMYMVDDSGDNLLLVAGTGEVPCQHVGKDYRLNIENDDTPVTIAARTRKGQFDNNVSQEHNLDFNPFLPETRSQIALPMIAGGKLLGVLEAHANVSDGFNEDDIRIKTILAEQIAISLQNAQSFQDTQRSEALMTNMINTIPDLIFYKDMNGTYIGANDAFGEFVGRPVDKIIGYTDYDLFGEEVAEFFREQDSVMLEQGETRRNEEWVKYPDGRNVLLNTLKTPLRGAEGEIIGLLGVSRDITELRQQQDIIEESRARMQDAVRTARLGYWEFDVATGNFTFNDDFYALLGTSLKDEGSTQMSAEDYAGRFIVPEQAPVVAEAINAAMETTDPNFTMELESDIIRADNGERRTLAVRLRIEKDEDGNTVKLIGANQDITERKQQQDALDSQRRLLDAIVNNIPSGIFVVEAPSATPIFSNRRAEELLGRGISPDANEEHLAEVYEAYKAGTDELYPAAEQPVVRGLYGEISRIDDMEVRRPDGSAILLEIAGAPIKDDEGNVVASVVSFEDITERRAQEVALAESRERMQDAVRTARLGYWEFDYASGNFTFDDDYYSLLGTSLEVEGAVMPAQEYAERFVVPEHAAIVGENVAEAATTDDPNFALELEADIIRADNGERRTMLVKLRVVKDEDGNTVKLVGTNQDITERKAQEQEIQKRAIELQTVAEVSAQATSTLDVDVLLKNVSDLTKERFDLYHAHIYLLDDAGKNLVLAAGAGDTGDKMVKKGHAIPIDREHSLVARAARERDGIIANDVTEAPDFMANKMLPDTRSEMAIPMVVGDTLVGVLDVQSTRVGRFTDEDVRIKRSLSDQVAVAVQNARAFQRIEAAQRATEDMRSAMDASAIVAFTDVTGKITYVNDRFCEISKYEREELIGQDHRIINSGHHSKEFIRDLWVTIANGNIWRGEIKNRAKDGSYYWVDTTIVPFLNENGKPYQYVAIRYEITERVAQQDEIQKRANEVEMVAAIGAEVVSEQNVSELLWTVSNLTKENFNRYHAHIYLVDDGGQNLTLVAGAGEVGRQLVEQGHSIPLDKEDSVVARAARKRVGVVIADTHEDEGFLPNPLLPDTRSELAVPITLNNAVIGVLDVQDSYPEAFSDAEVQSLMILANQIAAAIRNAQAFERVEEARQEVQRVFNASIDMLGSANFQGHFTSLNPAWGKTLGWTEEELMAKPFIEFVHPDDVEMTNSEAAKIFGGDDAISFENRYLHKDGSYRWISWNSVADVENELIHFVARDVTASKEAQRMIETSRERAETLAAINALLSQANEEQDILTAVAPIAERYDVTMSTLTYYVGENNPLDVAEVVAARSGDGQDVPLSFLPSTTLIRDSFPIIDYLAERGDQVTVVNVDDDFLTDAVREYMIGGGITTSILIPMTKGREWLGILSFAWIENVPISQDLLDLAEAIRTTASSVVASRRAYLEAEQERAENEKRANELETVARVSTATTTILEADELLHSVVTLTRDSFQLYHAHIYLLNDDETRLVLAAGAGEPGRIMEERGHFIPMYNSNSIVVQAAKTGKGVIVKDVTANENFLPNPLLPETQSEIAIPMIVAGQVIGVLDVQSEQVGRFTEDDLPIITTLADQISIATQNAKLFTAVEEQAELERETAERLREVDRLKSQFLANMSHELRTPLNSIIGYSEVLLDGVDGDLTEDAEEDVEAIHNSGKHLLSIINEILDLAKIEAGEMQLDRKEVDVAEFAAEIVRSGQVLVKDKPVDLLLVNDEPLPVVIADPIRLRQVIWNLMSNAVKFTEEGSVQIILERVDEDFIRVVVKDTGVGMTEEGLNVIFERFSQVDGSSTRRAGGTGLGLTITKQLIEMHGGEIQVTSKMGEGSTFWFTLPVNVAEAV